LPWVSLKPTGICLLASLRRAGVSTAGHDHQPATWDPCHRPEEACARFEAPYRARALTRLWGPWPGRPPGRRRPEPPVLGTPCPRAGGNNPSGPPAGETYELDRAPLLGSYRFGPDGFAMPQWTGPQDGTWAAWTGNPRVGRKPCWRRGLLHGTRPDPEIATAAPRPHAGRTSRSAGIRRVYPGAQAGRMFTTWTSALGHSVFTRGPTGFPPTRPPLAQAGFPLLRPGCPGAFSRVEAPWADRSRAWGRGKILAHRGH